MVHILGGASVKLSRNDLFELLRTRGALRPTHSDSTNFLLKYVLETIGKENVNTNDAKNLKKTITSFGISLWRKWKKTNGYLQRFKTANKEWLADLITSGIEVTSSTSSSSSSLRGRPKVNFATASEQTKRRRIKPLLCSNWTKEELALEASKKLHADGKRAVACVVNNAVSLPRCAKDLKKNTSDESVNFSDDEALALFVSLKLTRSQYIGLRNAVKSKNLKNLFPSYHKIIEAKKRCYPQSNIVITETSAEVPLQSLLDHTVSRLGDLQQEVLLSYSSSESSNNNNLQMFYKWGADGSGSQSNYKQKFTNKEMDDSSIFATSIVPLRLSSETSNGVVVLWQNPRTSSTRFCRPIRIQFIKETDNIIKSEFAYIEDQIRSLASTKIHVNDTEYNVNHHLEKTMVDGKICNSLMSNTSTQKCYICKAGPKEFNKLEIIKSRPCDTASLGLGLSSLHAYIRCFECLLHVSYRLDIKSWQVRGDCKVVFNERKKRIITEFRKEMGLLVDMPKPGFGNTNDGNTARRFFADPALSSHITGIDENLIYRFSVILKALSCGFSVNSTRFDDYAWETAQLYVSLYEWFPMSPTVHKILIHSKVIMDSFFLPIGQLSEDAQESRHKEIKYYREHNTRKFSRTSVNEDLLKILLVSSDPLISSLRTLPAKRSGILNKDVTNLLEEVNLESLSDDEVFSDSND